MKPHVIKSALADGLTTLVPVGVSVDVTPAARRLGAQLERLAQEKQPRVARRSARKKR